ncbi:class I SAM-dependent methyltransferase [Nocardia sp. NPDC057668]|uniref:class I SAM-dependent methyltransferase n=1 Tax=Nocardia sp. NPDC057668 TaxID=3346202 RepID=UPI00366B7CBB
MSADGRTVSRRAAGDAGASSRIGAFLRARLDRAAAQRAGRIAARVAPHLPVGGRVIDIGSGTGHNTEALRAVTASSFVETDVVDMHVAGPAPVLCADGALPFADNAFEAALVLHVLQFPTDATVLLREAGRVAPRIIVLQSTVGGPAGHAALVVRGFLFGRLAFRIARAVGYVAPTPQALRVLRVFSRADVRAAAAAAGLRVTAFEADRFPVPFGGRDLFVLERAE